MIKELDYPFTGISVYDKTQDSINENNFISFNGNKVRATITILMKAYKSDIIFSTHIYLAKALFPILFLRNMPRLFFSAHGIEVWRPLPYLIQAVLQKSTLLPVSNFTKYKMLEMNPSLHNSKIVVLPNCLRKPNQQNQDGFSTANKTKFKILSVGRLATGKENKKGFPSLIKAIALVKKSIPNIELTIVGRGDRLPELMSLTEQLKLNHYVKFKGFVPQLESFYRDCDVFALPSASEGFGIVYLEAMNEAKPLIGALGCGSSDVINDGENGFLCPYNDSNAIAEKITFLYNNPEQAKIMGYKGKKKLEKEFSFDAVKNQVANFFNQN